MTKSRREKILPAARSAAHPVQAPLIRSRLRPRNKSHVEELVTSSQHVKPSHDIHRHANESTIQEQQSTADAYQSSRRDPPKPAMNAAHTNTTNTQAQDPTHQRALRTHENTARNREQNQRKPKVQHKSQLSFPSNDAVGGGSNHAKLRLQCEGPSKVFSAASRNVPCTLHTLLSRQRCT